MVPSSLQNYETGQGTTTEISVATGRVAVGRTRSGILQLTLLHEEEETVVRTVVTEHSELEVNCEEGGDMRSELGGQQTITAGHLHCRAVCHWRYYLN